VALGDELEIIKHVHPAGSTDLFGEELSDRTVTTLTYAVGDETKAVACLFAPLNPSGLTVRALLTCENSLLNGNF